MRAIGYAAAACAALMPFTAAAADFLYPWKPGVALRQASDDQTACLAGAKAAGTQVDGDEQRRMRGQPAPPVPANSKAWLAAGMDGQTAFFNSYYDCLRGRGYSIRRLPSRDYAALKKGPDGGMAVMRAMVAPDSPHAEVPPGTIK